MSDVGDLEEQVRKAANADLSSWSDDDLLADAKRWERMAAMVEAGRAHNLGELDRREVCDREFGSSTSTWVARETKGDRVAIASRVNLAAKLRHPLVQVDAALSDGQISFEHARALVRAGNPRVLEELAEQQQAWLEGALDRPFRVWAHELKVWAELIDQDGPFDPNAELARNQLSLRPIGRGITLSGEFHGVEAVAFRQAVEARATELWDQYKADHARCPEDIDIPPYNTLTALAAVELVREGATAHGKGGAEPADVTLVVNAEAPEVVATPDGDIELSIEQVEHLLCDANWKMVTTSLVGVILNLGLTRRYANRAQRRALSIRDGGCVFPGCGARASWCDAHHVHHWEHDGPTDMCNLALLCRRHHGVTHRAGWTMVATEDERFIWTTPSGRVLHSQRHRGKPPPGT